MLISLFLLISAINAATPILNRHNVSAVYWGQNAGYWAAGGGDETANKGMQKRLGYYCNEDVDIILISFLHKFGSGKPIQMNFASMGEYTSAAPTTFPDMEADIIDCQKKGKQVFLSLGGEANGGYGLQSSAYAKEFAQTLHNMFGNGKDAGKNGTPARPFGNAIVDGIDLDIEGGEGREFWPQFVEAYRDIDKTMLLAMAPQCPYNEWNSEPNLQPCIDGAFFDYVFIQFYNTPWCSPQGNNFTYWYWNEWANQKSSQMPSKKSINPNVRIFVGTPAHDTSAGTGYQGWNGIQSVIDRVISAGIDYLGGIMMWDASSAYFNMQNGHNFLAYTVSLLPGSTHVPNSNSTSIGS